MPVIKLTDTLVAAFICPEDRTHIEVFDALMKGLYVDILANGRMSYRVRYYLQGKKCTYTLGNARVLTVAEARVQARDILRKVMVGIDPKVVTDNILLGVTVRTFFNEQYLPYVKSYKRSWSIDESVIRNHILPTLGDQLMEVITPPDIARLVEALKRKHYAAGSINRVLVLLRYGYALALRWRVQGIDNNPAKEIKNIKEDNRIENYLDASQAKKIIAAVKQSSNKMLAPIVAFLIYTGARKREVLDAKWQDIDWRNKQWRIPKTKSGKIRYVPLSSGALHVLTTLKVEHTTCSYIFANPKTCRPFVSFFCSWDTARKSVGMADIRIHDLRHSFASFLVNAGRSLYEVQELLGHADIRTTSRYAHLSQERLREAVESISLGW